jgi:hypothetical protein
VSGVRTSRRTFIQMMAVVSLTPAVPSLPITDTYGEFLQRIRDHIVRIVRRDGRAIQEIVIEPPHVLNGQTFRLVRVWLEGFVRPYTWNEPL